MNTGHDVKLVLDDPSPHAINISGGPLSYKYRVAEITFHFGSIDSIGSEHTIDGQSFPAEVSCPHDIHCLAKVLSTSYTSEKGA